MSGVFNDIFGLGSGARTTTTTQTPVVPTDVETARRDLLGRATAFANEPYAPYTTSSGQAIPRVAGFAPDQLSAFQNVRNLAGTSGALGALTPGLTTEAISRARGLATTLPETNIQAYMSPYTESVLDPAIRDIEERSARQRLSLGQQAARTGSFGGSRQAVAESELERSTQRNIGEISAAERAKAYNQALDQFRKDQSNIPDLYKGALGALTSGLAQTASRLGTEYSPLLQTGSAQQALEQAQLDVLRREFEEQRDYPLRGLEALRGALGLGASTLGIGQAGTETRPGPNVLGQVLGTVAAAPKVIQGASSIWDWASGLFSSSPSQT